MNRKHTSATDHIVESALENLVDSTGFAGKWKSNAGKDGLDGQLTLALPSGKLVFQAEAKRTLRRQQLADIFERAQNNTAFILIAEELFPKLKAELRANHVAYLDGAGNLFVSLNGHYIWIDRNKPAKTERRTAGRAFTKAGLKVVFHLLTHSGALESSHREIAANSGVALGNISLIMSGLKESGFLVELSSRKFIFTNKSLLLDKWIDAYQRLLKPALFIGSFDFSDKSVRANWKQLRLLPGDEWGGEPAAEMATDHLNAEKLTVYSKHTRSETIKHWKLIPAKNGGLEVYQKFWDDDQGTSTASHLLAYADLVAMDDPRCFETAKIIYNTHLKALFDEQNPAQSTFRHT